MIAASVLALAGLAQVAFDRASVIERWRESLALDLPGAVLAESERLLATGGALARDGDAIALAARAALVARGPDAARSILESADATAATEVAVEVERARLAIELDDLDGALALLLATRDASLPKRAERPDAWLLAGRALARLGELERAAPFLARFVELAPRDAEAPAALHLLAQAAIARGEAQTARALAARADEAARWHSYWKVRVLQIRERPDDPLPRLGLGQLWLAAGDGAKAEAVLRDLVARAPTFAPGWFHVGEAERMQGDLTAALAAYSRALEIEPDHLLALHNRATIHRLAGRAAEARADYERIVAGPRASEPLALPAHLELARVLDAAGDRDAAAQRYARYRELGGTEPLRPADRR